MNKELKHIKENITYVKANRLLKIYLTKTFQISARWKYCEIPLSGEIQKIYLDKDGEAIGYDIYIY